MWRTCLGQEKDLVPVQEEDLRRVQEEDRIFTNMLKKRSWELHVQLKLFRRNTYKSRSYLPM